MEGFHFYVAFYFHFLYKYKRIHSNRLYPFTDDPLKGGVMTKIILGLLIIVVLILCFLLFWIVILSAALLFFGKGGRKKEGLLTEKPRAT